MISIQPHTWSFKFHSLVRVLLIEVWWVHPARFRQPCWLFCSKLLIQSRSQSLRYLRACKALGTRLISSLCRLYVLHSVFGDVLIDEKAKAFTTETVTSKKKKKIHILALVYYNNEKEKKEVSKQKILGDNHSRSRKKLQKLIYHSSEVN